MKSTRPSECIAISDKNGAELYSTLPPECLSCMSACNSESESFCCNSESTTRRRGKHKDGNGATFFCTSEKDLVNSSKTFKKELLMQHRLINRLASAREEIARQETNKTNRLFHNLVSLNAHAMQEFYAMVPQDELSTSGGFSAQKTLIKNKLMSNTDAAAKLFLRALKNETAVKNELSVFRKLHDPNPILRPQPHPIHKVILNVVNLFFQDLADNEIRVSIENTTVVLTLDYEALQVALYHLVDNACKYTRPNSEIRISVTTSASRICLIFDMYSHYVSPEERQLVFEDDYSGAQAIAGNLNGKGLGMRLIKDLLALNGGSMAVTWGDLEMTPAPKNGDPIYVRNSFIISFPIEILRHR